MKVKTIIFSEQCPGYAAPEITTVDMTAEGILCYSTEQLQENDFDPWATATE